MYKVCNYSCKVSVYINQRILNSQPDERKVNINRASTVTNTCDNYQLAISSRETFVYPDTSSVICL